MGKKKGNKASSGGPAAGNHADASTTKNPSACALPPSTALNPDDPLYAVIEFHHMLIGPTHKKEAAALGAAASYGICGFIFMGGPSLAVIEAATVDDVRGWLSDCKKAGKEGSCVFWKAKIEKTAPSLNNKLKVMAYAPGKDTKMDMAGYQQTLARLNIPFPLPSCAPLL